MQPRYPPPAAGWEHGPAVGGREGIGSTPCSPLAPGAPGLPGVSGDRPPARHEATPGQVALAWLLWRSPVMLPIPGTSSVEHLVENVAAASLELDEEEFAELR